MDTQVHRDDIAFVAIAFVASYAGVHISVFRFMLDATRLSRTETSLNVEIISCIACALSSVLVSSNGDCIAAC